MQSIGLYIHIPFCEQKCFYCDFASYQGKSHLIQDYLGALELEIQNKTQGLLFDTIFIGGGTPSFLSKKWGSTDYPSDFNQAMIQFFLILGESIHLKSLKKTIRCFVNWDS